MGDRKGGGIGMEERSSKVRVDNGVVFCMGGR